MINSIVKSIFLKNIFNKETTTHFNIISLLFILLPFTLVTGPFVPDLILTIISIYFLIISFKNKIFFYYKNYAVYFFCIFYFCIIVSGLLSEHPYESLLDYNGPVFFIRYLFLS